MMERHEHKSGRDAGWYVSDSSPYCRKLTPRSKPSPGTEEGLNLSGFLHTNSKSRKLSDSSNYSLFSQHPDTNPYMGLDSFMTSPRLRQEYAKIRPDSDLFKLFHGENISNTNNSGGGFYSDSNEKYDSPLDFSKKKPKYTNQDTRDGDIESDGGALEEESSAELPTQLKRMLNMNSSTERFAKSRAVGNNESEEGLRKTPNSSRCSRTSTPLTPLRSSPQPQANAESLTSPGEGDEANLFFNHGNNGTSINPFPVPPWGSGVYDSNLSPMLNHATLPEMQIAMEPTAASLLARQMLMSNLGASGYAYGPNMPGPLLSGSLAQSKGKSGRPLKDHMLCKEALGHSFHGLFPDNISHEIQLKRAKTEETFQEFRRHQLESAGGTGTRRCGRQKLYGSPRSDSSNEGMEKDSNNMNDCSSEHSLPYEKSKHQNKADPAYLERRKKNNAAAKRSRDARRNKEDEKSIRLQYLETNYSTLLAENCVLNDIIKQLKNQIRYLTTNEICN